MNKRLFVALLVLFFSLGSFAQEGNPIALEISAPAAPLGPGKLHTFILKIKNTSTEAITVSPAFDFPEQWRLITNVQNIQISGQEQKILLVSFNVPSKCPAGEYAVTYKVSSVGLPEKTTAEIQQKYVVEEIKAIALELVDAPGFVKAGDNISASFIVRNNGNSEQEIFLSAGNCEIKNNKRVVLPSGGSAVVDVFSETDADLIFPTRRGISVKARMGDNTEKELYEYIQVLPSKQEENDLYHRLPVSVTSRYLSSGRDGIFEDGYQFEVKGAGSIDPEGIHKIDFLARGPNQFDLSLLGLYDEYYFSYTNNYFSFFAGDKSYTLTPLTEYSRYGRGIENKISINKTADIGFLYLKPRFYDRIVSEYAAYGHLNIYRENEIGLYYIKKFMPEKTGDIGLYSITSKLQPFAETTVDLEFSRGKVGTKADNGFRVNVNSQFSRFSFSSYYYKTGKNFPGYYTNSNFYSGLLNYNVTNWLTAGVSARQDFVNAALDTLFMTAPFSKQWQGILNFKVGDNMFMKTYYSQYERKDRSALQKFHYESRSANAFFSHNLNKIGYNLNGEYGKTRNLMLASGEDNKNTFRATANISYSPNYRYNVIAFSSYSNVNSFISDQQNDWIFGLSASAQFTRNLRASMQVQNSYSIEDYYQNRDLFQFNLDYLFLKKHKISVNSYYTIFQNEVENPDYTFSVSYSVNFGIPMKQIAEAGSVSGKISNQGVETTEGIIIYLGGKTCITGADGNFEFKNLKAGKYTLLIGREKLNITDIPDIQSPIEIIVEGNKVTRLDFGLTNAAKLSGRFEIEKAETQTKLLEKKEEPIGHIVIELFRGDEKYRIISDEKGRFVFPLIRPGKWFLKIFSNGIPNQYVLESDHYEFDLAPGENKDILVKLLIRKRNIIFLNNSINLSPDEKK